MTITTTELHVIRTFLGVVAFLVACTAISRSLALDDLNQWPRFTLALYSYAIAASQLTGFNRQITTGTIFIFIAELFSIIYLLKAWHIWFSEWRNEKRKKRDRLHEEED